jgi:ethanolamine permease
MAAEEAKDPHRSVPIAYIGGILTLVALALGVMVFAGGSGDWTKLANINDPLPQAMKTVVGADSGWLHMLVWLGLFGLIASFHGIIIGYSRQIFALSRAGYLPAVLGRIHPRLGTPHVAILAGGAVGIAAIFSDELVKFGGQSLTANIVTMSVFGAIVMYILSMASLFKLRRSEPGLARPFSAPAYPVFPAFALAPPVICLATMVYFNALVAALFAGLAAVGYGYFLTTRRDAARRSRRGRSATTPDRSPARRRCKSAIRLRSATPCNTSRPASVNLRQRFCAEQSVAAPRAPQRSPQA